MHSLPYSPSSYKRLSLHHSPHTYASLDVLFVLPALLDLKRCTCSALNAACHQLIPEDSEAHRFPVQRGVMGCYNSTGVGHCSFVTARDATPPKISNKYT